MRHEAIDARNFFAAEKAPVRLNQFGGSAGGPLLRNRTFLFGTWERTRQRTGETLLSTVPTLGNREGDFSDLADGQRPADPHLRSGDAAAVSWQRHPPHRLDPVALAAVAYYPLPNRTGTSTNANNYGGNSSAWLDRDIVVAPTGSSVRAERPADGTLLPQ